MPRQTSRGLKLYEILLVALLPFLPCALGEDVSCSASSHESYEYSCLISGEHNMTLYYTYSHGESIKIGIEAVSSGYVALGWTEIANEMIGSEAVMAWIDDDSVSSVKTYILTSQSSSGIEEGGFEITNTSTTRTGDVLFAEWTRPLTSEETASGNMLWALCSETSKTRHDIGRGKLFDLHVPTNAHE
ncbi:hypothetical protein CYMTET_30359 [Cymbomonas tetramitiformis]|uniref:DOMON domain-containing protein n=1 Tax=Cymbomonas tetramitiformis TaxID=36881 RepID=A0AAE0FJG5_9CHLO|nr:hypothetical protein CYMTET_30359 [Cymbomonas tetramitiformis]